MEFGITMATQSTNHGSNVLMGISNFGLGGGSGGLHGNSGEIPDPPHSLGNNSQIIVLPGESAKLACPIPAELYGTVRL